MKIISIFIFVVTTVMNSDAMLRVSEKAMGRTGQQMLRVAPRVPTSAASFRPSNVANLGTSVSSTLRANVASAAPFKAPPVNIKPPTGSFQSSTFQSSRFTQPEIKLMEKYKLTEWEGVGRLRSTYEERLKMSTEELWNKIPQKPEGVKPIKSTWDMAIYHAFKRRNPELATRGKGDFVKALQNLEAGEWNEISNRDILHLYDLGWIEAKGPDPVYAAGILLQLLVLQELIHGLIIEVRPWLKIKKLLSDKLLSSNTDSNSV